MILKNFFDVDNLTLGENAIEKLIHYKHITVMATLFPSASGRILTFDFRIMSQVFYNYVTLA